ncbi:DEAD/DEAH box helicase [Providencia alcalifaciens]|uniref:DEAD/DEAH box helicase n=2 Tax=Enterobacterales TaxID=91347 RepID=UPI000D853FCB|nr:DEAD/DEAH box helicase [Providencia alcalifaciens]MTC29234.1 DEAD/DEAH box helicase [Providencia alcalifaciens]SPY73022.1 Superfamily II helicase [Providencia alcalifaciens]
MVNFKKHLAGRVAQKPTDPVALYDTLDRQHDKGPLRPAQEAILKAWHQDQAKLRDVIVKLHTGQGKTLIGLLMLQSRLNAGNSPVVYLCPDHFLINQTCEQAKQFGIRTCTSEGELPEEFINGDRILVTSASKLFNGMTKFGLHNQSILLDTVLMDDAHACSDRIREQCRIRIPREEPAYSRLLSLFRAELEQQGIGTFAEIENEKREAFLPVPYWSWLNHESEVASILAQDADRKSIKFAWPLLKDMLKHCQCIVSGLAIEIEPYVAPLDTFGSYFKAKHRIFMSATVTDDAFLVKGLQLSAKTISQPLTYAKETWSGEKMILLPSIIHENLNREQMVKWLATPSDNRKFGRVGLTPSATRSKDWKSYGAVITDKDNVDDAIAKLLLGGYKETIVLVNRYDGIDLPDSACRILMFDSKPFSESLIDLYAERVRPNSKATLTKTMRTIEQGMGRSVRGEKDYSVIVVVGSELVRTLRDVTSRQYLSPQFAKQIEIGIELGKMAKQEIAEGENPTNAFNGLIKQCLTRDDDWKAYYAEQMNDVTPVGANKDILNIYEAELQAEKAYMAGDYIDAAKILQNLLDSGSVDANDKAWYLQERARYLYNSARADSQTQQKNAHKNNKLLLKPATGVTVTKLTLRSQGRVERIQKWIKNFDNYSELDVAVSDILERLVFGVKADKFEQALNELSFALGFIGERPDMEWKEGPDNLWALDDKNYLLIECKSEVDVTRSEVNKREAEQMNRSCAWFDKHYPGLDAKRIIIHPSGKIQSAAAFTHEVEGMREINLKNFVQSCRMFFKAFEGLNFKDLSDEHTQKLIDLYNLSVPKILSSYSKKLKDIKEWH